MSMWIFQRLPCSHEGIRHHSFGVPALAGCLPCCQTFLGRELSWYRCVVGMWTFASCVQWTRASKDWRALRLFFLFASLLALHVDGCLHISVMRRDRVTRLASLQASKSWCLCAKVSGHNIGFSVVCLELEPPYCWSNASTFVPLKCRISEMLWHSYKCYKIESSALQVRLNCQSNTLITGKINHVRNSNKSVSFLETEIYAVIRRDFQ